MTNISLLIDGERLDYPINVFAKKQIYKTEFKWKLTLKSMTGTLQIKVQYIALTVK